MLRQFAGAVAGSLGAASLAHAATDDGQFELLATTLDGRMTMAIVDARGIAIAIELEEERGQIVRGVAAGAILSELRDALNAPADQIRSVASGSAVSSVEINDRVVVGGAGPDQITAAVQSLTQLTPAQKSELLALLGLETHARGARPRP